jgi:hypothetical protein
MEFIRGELLSMFEFFKRLIYATILIAFVACEPDRQGGRVLKSDRPEELTVVEVVETDLNPSDGGSLSTGDTTISFPPGSLNGNYRVRLSRFAGTPELRREEAIVLGNPEGDIVQVEIYDVASQRIIGSDQLIKPYEIKQVFRTVEKTFENLGLILVTEPETPSEERYLMPSSEMTFTVGNTDQENEVLITTDLRVTSARVWLVRYTKDALNVMQIGRRAEVTNSGGSAMTDPLSQETSVQNASISINNGASATSSTEVSLSIAALNATEMYLTNEAECTSGGSWASFQTTRSWTLSQSNAMARVFVKFRDSSQIVSPCISDSIIHDNISPSVPANFDDGTTSSSLVSSPQFSWQASIEDGSGISHYQIAIGSTAGGTDINTWTSVGNVTSATLSSLSLVDGTTYYGSVRAVDVAGNTSDIAEGNGWVVSVPPPVDCPQDTNIWVRVPANPDVGVSSDFCVFKYEAKLGLANVAVSVASDPPWGGLARGASSSDVGSAWNECANWGAGYDLISNAQWQAIARNIESVATNWHTPSGQHPRLNQGHSDGMPSSILAASSDDNDACFETGQTCSSTVWNSQRRTHVLSNGEVIWDIAGNASEWTKDNSPDLNVQGYTSQLTASDFDKIKWGPSGDYYTTMPNSPYSGLGFSALRFTAAGSRAVVRGGTFADGDKAGVFASDINHFETGTDPYRGFRCVWTP